MYPFYLGISRNQEGHGEVTGTVGPLAGQDSGSTIRWFGVRTRQRRLTATVCQPWHVDRGHVDHGTPQDGYKTPVPVVPPTCQHPLCTSCALVPPPKLCPQNRSKAQRVLGSVPTECWNPSNIVYLGAKKYTANRESRRKSLGFSPPTQSYSHPGSFNRAKNTDGHGMSTMARRPRQC